MVINKMSLDYDDFFEEDYYVPSYYEFNDIVIDRGSIVYLDEFLTPKEMEEYYDDY